MQSNKKKENINEKHRLKRKVKSNKDKAINIKKTASSSTSAKKKTLEEDCNAMKTSKSQK